MKTLYTLLSLVLAFNLNAQDGKASTTKKTFNRTTSVSTTINAEASTIWKILTNGNDITRWNSTITSFKGTIAEGEKIELKSVLDDKRTFKLKVKEFEPDTKMIWGDGKGERVYLITPNGDGTCTFSMSEKIGGLMFPMYAKYLPSFDETFEQFAADLKREAEKE